MLCGCACVMPHRLVVGVATAGLPKGLDAARHGSIKLPDGRGGYKVEGVLQGNPQGLTVREDHPRQHATHHGPHMFHGVHVRAVRGPDASIKLTNPLLFQELDSGPGLVHRGPVLLERPTQPVPAKDIGETSVFSPRHETMHLNFRNFIADAKTA